MSANSAWRVMRIATIAAAMGGASVRADYNVPSFFVDDPTKNSRDWGLSVLAEGGQVNTDVNFQAMPTGTLVGNFYNSPAHPDGVTLLASDASINTIVHDGGPGQMGQATPISPGEGTAPAENYLLSTSPGQGKGSSLTIKFSAPVMAVGLFTIDYFGAIPTTNTLTLSVYSTTGAFLGSADAMHDDFQSDKLYFMGFVAPTDEIGSAVFTRGSDGAGDTIGIGPIEFATSTVESAVPEPSALLLAAVGGSCLLIRAALRRRRLA